MKTKKVINNTLDEHVSIYERQNPYDYDNSIILNWYPRRVVEQAKNSNSILELGLGHGYTAEIFANYFKRHVILEGSSAVIENYKNLFPNSTPLIIETYFENFETDEKFDIIVMGFILEHVDNPLQVMAHFKNFLSPTGKMFITVPNAEALNRRLGYYAGILSDLEHLSENDIISGHKRYYTVDSLTSEIKSIGFKIEKIEGIYLKPFTTKQMLSLNFDEKIINALCIAGIDYPELSLGILVVLKLN
jgi:2-polyprenyl-3-methyl-5-hydroxy-6-metoxy-1,4-benzoquinol methylase